MVLQDNYFKKTKNAIDLTEDWRQYTIVKHNYWNEYEGKADFREGINVWGLICALRQINNVLKEISGNNTPHFNYSILFDSIASIDANAPFTMEQLAQYIKLFQEIEDFIDKGFDVFNIDLIEDLYVGVGVDMVVSGISISKYTELEKLDEQIAYHFRDDLFDLKWKAIKKKLSVEEYKEKALKLLDKAFEETKKEGEKAA